MSQSSDEAYRHPRPWPPLRRVDPQELAHYLVNILYHDIGKTNTSRLVFNFQTISDDACRTQLQWRLSFFFGSPEILVSRVFAAFLIRYCPPSADVLNLEMWASTVHDNEEFDDQEDEGQN